MWLFLQQAAVNVIKKNAGDSQVSNSHKMAPMLFFPITWGTGDGRESTIELLTLPENICCNFLIKADISKF